MASSLYDKINNLRMEDVPDAAMPQGPPLKILLLGKTGMGKSYTGNLILSDSKDDYIPQIFPSTGSSISVTAVVTNQTRTVRGREITVVDTPGVCDTSKNDDIVLKEIASAVVELPTGYDVFIIIIKYPTRLTPEEHKAIRQLIELFGEKIYDYALLVMTNGKTFEINQRTAVKQGQQDKPLTIEEFVKQDELSTDEGALGPIAKKFKGGIVLVENLEEDYLKREAMVHEVVLKADAIVQRNNGKPYTNYMFDLANSRISQLMQKKEPEGAAKETVTQEVKEEAKRRSRCTIL